MKAQTTLAPSFVWLDIARALAAAIVLAGHLRAYVLNDFAGSLNPSLAWRAFYFVTSLQHEAVVVFFVLSGFLISKTVTEQDSTGKWSWCLYALKRLSRLWIVLLPALVLTFTWDQLGIRTSGSALYLGALNIANHSTPLTPLSFSASTLLGNVFFLQSVRVPSYGTDTPLWSLANEFWYYVLFPVFYFSIRRKYSIAARLALCAVGTALCIWLVPAQCPLALIWLMGYGAFLLHRHVQKKSMTIQIATLTGGSILLGLGLLSPFVLHISGIAQDAITGLAFAILLSSLAGFNVWGFVARPARVFAGFSYTLYVVHFPFVTFIMCALVHNRRFPPSTQGLGLFALLFLAAMAYAYLVSLIFESNTSAVQAAVIRAFKNLSHAHSYANPAFSEQK